jgi:hypothetical protein
MSDRLIAEAATYTTHNEHNRRTAMLSVRFEPPTPAIERPQTYDVYSTATGFG